MKIILREDVEKLGKAGEVVKVKDGFGRNYLIPRKLAVLANVRNMKALDHDRRTIETRETKTRKNPEAPGRKRRPAPPPRLSSPRRTGGGEGRESGHDGGRQRRLPPGSSPRPACGAGRPRVGP